VHVSGSVFKAQACTKSGARKNEATDLSVEAIYNGGEFLHCLHCVHPSFSFCMQVGRKVTCWSHVTTHDCTTHPNQTRSFTCGCACLHCTATGREKAAACMRHTTPHNRARTWAHGCACLHCTATEREKAVACMSA